jgi:hypothetical protein
MKMRIAEASIHKYNKPRTITLANREILDATSTLVTLVARLVGVPSIGTRHEITPSAD